MSGATGKDWGDAFRSEPSIENLQALREEDFERLVDDAVKYREEQQRDDQAHGARLRKCRDALEESIRLYLESRDQVRHARQGRYQQPAAAIWSGNSRRKGLSFKPDRER